jgi:hypothetical protein
MIEKDIIKHAKRTFAIFKSEGKTMKHKIMEIVTEVLIIIVAVTVSIWLHNWSESRRDRKEEKEFLIGLKTDLQKDIERMKSSETFYENTLAGIDYFLEIGTKTEMNRDSVGKYEWIFFSSSNLDPYTGRYEGLKSSGRFSIIENKELLNNIITLHETIITRIQYLNEMYYQHNQKLEDLISQKVRLGKNGEVTNADMVVGRSDFKILLVTSRGLIAGNIIPIHEAGISKCNEIIDQINRELE